MRQVVPYVTNFLSKFSLEVIPAVAASVLAGVLLTHFHLRGDPVQRASLPAEPVQAAPAKAPPSGAGAAVKGAAAAKPGKAEAAKAEPKSDAGKPDGAKSEGAKSESAKSDNSKTDNSMTASEDRKMTRDILRTRRDSDEPPAEVTKRVPSINPEDLENKIKAAIAAPAEDAAAPLPPAAPVVRTPRAETARATTPLEVPRRADSTEPSGGFPAGASQVIGPAPGQMPAQVAGQPVLAPPSSPLYVPPPSAAPAPAAAAPVDLASAQPAPTAGQPAPGAVGNVLSEASVATGKAVNAVGDTVNFVVGLPGKLIGR
jgi:hypothetical protein